MTNIKEDKDQAPEAGHTEVSVATGTQQTMPVKKTTPKTKPDDSATRALQIRYNFYKWLLGSFLIGAFTAVTTFIFKGYEFKLKTRQEESAYLKPYLDNYMKLFGKNTLGYDRAADMAKFLSCSVVDKDYKEGWNDLFNYCQNRIVELTKKNDSITLISSMNSLKMKSLNERKDKISARPGNRLSNSDTALKKIQDTLKMLYNKQVSLVAEKIVNLNKIDPALTGHDAINFTHVNQNSLSQITDPSTETFTAIYDSTKNIPKFSYQTFAKVFRITVNSVRPDKETCNITLYTMENDKPKVFKEDVDLDLHHQHTFYSSDRQYLFWIQVTNMYIQNLRTYATFRVIVSKKAF